MKTLVIILLLVFALAGICSADFPLNVRTYTNEKAKGSLPAPMEIYIKGAGEGFLVANGWLEMKKRPLLFCPPEKLGLNMDSLIKILDDEIQYEKSFLTGTQNSIDEYPVSMILLLGLQRKFPCK